MHPHRCAPALLPGPQPPEAASLPQTRPIGGHAPAAGRGVLAVLCSSTEGLAKEEEADDRLRDLNAPGLRLLQLLDPTAGSRQQLTPAWSAMCRTSPGSLPQLLGTPIRGALPLDRAGASCCIFSSQLPRVEAMGWRWPEACIGPAPIDSNFPDEGEWVSRWGEAAPPFNGAARQSWREV